MLLKVLVVNIQPDPHIYELCIWRFDKLKNKYFFKKENYIKIEHILMYFLSLFYEE